MIENSWWQTLPQSCHLLLNLLVFQRFLSTLQRLATHVRWSHKLAEVLPSGGNPPSCLFFRGNGMNRLSSVTTSSSRWSTSAGTRFVWASRRRPKFLFIVRKCTKRSSVNSSALPDQIRKQLRHPRHGRSQVGASRNLRAPHYMHASPQRLRGNGWTHEGKDYP